MAPRVILANDSSCLLESCGIQEPQSSGTHTGSQSHPPNKFHHTTCVTGAQFYPDPKSCKKFIRGQNWTECTRQRKKKYRHDECCCSVVVARSRPLIPDPASAQWIRVRQVEPAHRALLNLFLHCNFRPEDQDEDLELSPCSQRILTEMHIIFNRSVFFSTCWLPKSVRVKGGAPVVLVDRNKPSSSDKPT